jgi:hypothetical protein
MSQLFQKTVKDIHSLKQVYNSQSTVILPPTTAVTIFRDLIKETEAFGFEKAHRARQYLDDSIVLRQIIKELLRHLQLMKSLYHVIQLAKKQPCNKELQKQAEEAMKMLVYACLTAQSSPPPLRRQ